ncbi:replication initiation protein [Lachnospiraceae bacterium 48-33]
MNELKTIRGLEKLSLKARKMLYIVISQCRQNDDKFYTYEISIKEFANMMDITPNVIYSEANHIINELISKVLYIAKQNPPCSIFSICEYYDGIFCFKLNPDMTTFLLELKKYFSKLFLDDFLKMKSTYSMTIWYLMQREMYSHKPNLTNTVQFDLTLNELREITGTQEKFIKLSNIKQFVFDKALREINENCGVKVTYQNIKRSRTVIGFRCSAVFVRTPQQDLYLSKEQIVKDKNMYSYTLRFDKDATLDHQALDKITQFCELTHMSKHAAMMFIFATADIPALYENISSLTVARDKLQKERINMVNIKEKKSCKKAVKKKKSRK